MAAGLLALGAAARAQAQFEPQRAWVAAARPDDPAPARVGILRARLDQPATLYAVVEGRRDGQTLIVTAAPALELRGRKARRLTPPAELADLEVRWFKVQPTGASYDNTEGGFHWATIDYAELALDPFGDGWSRPADARPIPPYPDVHGGAGTMAFKIEVRVGERVVASPGREALWHGGLSDDVTRVALRRDDSYLGRLTELFNTPYIWGSAGEPAGRHQAERLIGSDCADFIVYGVRQLGRSIPYRGSFHLPEVTRTVARGERVDKEGRFLDHNGAVLRIASDAIQIGDLLLFPRHVGALVEDREPLGVLDGHDVLIHTYWAPPCEQPIRETAYAASPVRVLRWK